MLLRRWWTQVQSSVDGWAALKMGSFTTQASAHFDTRRTPRTSHAAHRTPRTSHCTPHTTHCAPHAAHHSPLVHHYRLRGPSFSPSDRTLRARFALHQKGTMALSSDTEVWHARPATVALPRANTLHAPIALTLAPLAPSSAAKGAVRLRDLLRVLCRPPAADEWIPTLGT